MSTLNSVIKSQPKSRTLPLTLPAAHLSIARWFESVVDQGRLTPRRCDVFKRDLLYLFYGGIFYRTDRVSTENAADLPVAFLFKASSLTRAQCYFPFDTGALARGYYGEDWSKRLHPFKKRFKVNARRDVATPAKKVSLLYGDNESYLRGRVDRDAQGCPDPIPLLHDFLSEDLTRFGTDHRQTAIECHFNEPLELGKDLVWVGFPAASTEVFMKLCKKTAPHRPKYFDYDSHRIFNPGELAAILQHEAEQVLHRYASSS